MTSTESSIVTELEYQNDDQVVGAEEQLLVRAEPTGSHSGNLVLVVINSSFLVYTKVCFIRRDERQLGLAVSLF